MEQISLNLGKLIAEHAHALLMLVLLMLYLWKQRSYAHWVALAAVAFYSISMLHEEMGPIKVVTLFLMLAIALNVLPFSDKVRRYGAWMALVAAGYGLIDVYWGPHLVFSVFVSRLWAYIVIVIASAVFALTGSYLTGEKHV